MVRINEKPRVKIISPLSGEEIMMKNKPYSFHIIGTAMSLDEIDEVYLSVYDCARCKITISSHRALYSNHNYLWEYHIPEWAITPGEEVRVQIQACDKAGRWSLAEVVAVSTELLAA